jgi:hypothetical protein
VTHNKRLIWVGFAVAALVLAGCTPQVSRSRSSDASSSADIAGADDGGAGDTGAAATGDDTGSTAGLDGTTGDTGGETSAGDAGTGDTGDTTDAGDTGGGTTGDDGAPAPCASDEECNNDNPCTTDLCGVGGECKHIAVAGACDDGHPCTLEDTCIETICIGTAKDCGDDNDCTDDTCDPTGTCQHVGTDSPCDDGNACTDNDQCSNTLCLPGPLIQCDDGSPCTIDACNLALGECEFQHIGDGAFCDDGDLCTVGDECIGLECTSGLVPDCNDGNPCTDDGCDPQSGFCSSLNNNSPCDDGDVCTSEDACANGQCTGGTGDGCDDNNPCTDDFCDPILGTCSYLNGVGACDDGDECTTGDFCSFGVCNSGPGPSCDDANGCTTDACSPVTGLCEYTPKSGACEDGDFCTLFDTCQEAACVGGTNKSCDDADPCTVDMCSPVTGICSSTAGNQGALCDDFDFCTLEDACSAGQCLGVLKDCDDGDPCTTGEACAPFTGQCLAGGPIDCDDGNACTADDCTADLGCEHFAEGDGLECVAPSACEQGQCEAGQCVVVNGLDCDDGNPCTIDTCDPINGCAYQNEDCGSTTIDCLTGACDPVDGCIFDTDDASCDDSIACSVDACEPGLGCTHTYPEGCCAEQPLVQDFELAPPGWSLGGGPTVKWQQVSDLKSVAGLGSLYYGNPVALNYDSGSINSGTATSPSFVVPNSPSPKLRFWIWMHLESSASYDNILVKVNGSQVWSKLGLAMQQWHQVTVELTGWSGQAATLAFEFSSVDSVLNTLGGIYIDDIQVLGCD